jgi:hypothetical protein
MIKNTLGTRTNRILATKPRSFVSIALTPGTGQLHPKNNIYWAIKTEQ